MILEIKAINPRTYSAVLGSADNGFDFYYLDAKSRFQPERISQGESYYLPADERLGLKDPSGRFARQQFKSPEDAKNYLARIAHTEKMLALAAQQKRVPSIAA